MFFGALLLYVVGFICQFYWFGWTIAEFFFAPAIVMIFYALFSDIKHHVFLEAITKTGTLSYSFFLMHDFFVSRLNEYFGSESIASFWKTIALATVFSLLTAMFIDKFVPIISKAFYSHFAYIDRKLMSRQ